LNVWAEQAIFTSLVRRGRGGYQLVSRSKGIDESDTPALARWAPSHGALLMDANNRTSVNFHSLPSGRFALSRTCAGPMEYSGRGGRQLYTHFLIVDAAALECSDFQPFSIYRDAMALGYFLYQINPKEVLHAVRLSELHPRRDSSVWQDRAADLGLSQPRAVLDRLLSGQSVRFGYAGDRTALAECLIGMLPSDAVSRTSFATNLVPSSVRPFALSLVTADFT
jgi:hypothetical protein